VREADLQRQSGNVREDSASLSDWLLSFGKTQAYASLVSRFEQRAGYITPPEETAVLYAIVQRLRPQWSLEIGTFFANTTRIMAEAIVDAAIDGKLITLDPFGQERVPAILQSWPDPLRAVTDFRSWNSMQYFLELETLGIAKGADSPLGVVFVDGHHNFEYALYDIIRSADHLAPSGVIMVDNLEQEGPKMAAIQFLRWNPAWSLFYKGGLFYADNIDESTICVSYDAEILWGVLLAPAGIQAARHPTKLMKRGITYAPLRAVTFNLRHTSHPGTLHLNMAYYVVPHDFHITGQGMSLRRGKGKVFVSGRESTVTINFPSPLTLEISRPDSSTCYEIELSFESEVSAHAYLVLDAREPSSFQS
jgi:predicted O-methyltransferase YrrM